jgi:uncharacterized protein YvpB
MISIKGRTAAVGRLLLLASILGSTLGLFSPMSAKAAPASNVVEGFPSVTQWYSLSCEYAAAAAVTLYYGNVVSQREFIAEIPKSPNPHLGFRGDINGEFGGLTNYGVYAEALVPVLEAHGYNAVVFYGGVSRLKSNIGAGAPVVVWITVGKNIDRPVYSKSYNGETFKLVPGEHAMVAYGYDEGGVHLMDVGNGGFYYTDWSSFVRRWSYFDEMSLVIFPK